MRRVDDRDGIPRPMRDWGTAWPWVRMLLVSGMLVMMSLLGVDRLLYGDDAGTAGMDGYGAGSTAGGESSGAGNGGDVFAGSDVDPVPLEPDVAALLAGTSLAGVPVDELPGQVESGDQVTFMMPAGELAALVGNARTLASGPVLVTMTRWAADGGEVPAGEASGWGACERKLRTVLAGDGDVSVACVAALPGREVMLWDGSTIVDGELLPAVGVAVVRVPDDSSIG